MRFLSIAILLVAVTAGSARADKAAAEAAYREGKRLMGEGKVAEACVQYQASFDEDPQIGVELNLADCHEQIGRVASAWAEFGEAAESAHKKGDTRETFARQRADALEPRLSYLVINGPAEPIEDLTVRRDGSKVAALPSRVPVDPGEHQISAEAPGRESWKTTVTIDRDAQTEQVTVPALPAAKVTEPDDHHGTVKQKLVLDTHRRDQRRLFAMISAGVGVVATGGGLYFGKLAFDHWNDSRPDCPMDICNADGRKNVDSARSAALASDIFVGIGLAGLAGAAVLWFTAPGIERRMEDADVTFAPMVTGDGIGAMIVGNL